MNIIYLVGSIRSYAGDLLSGFATDVEGIKQIAINHYRDFLYTKPLMVDVTVCMAKKTIRVHDSEENETTTFYIHTIERAV
jgi:hypothetical protein